MLQIVPDKSDKKQPPNLENVHRVIAHSGQCFALDLDPKGRYVHIHIHDTTIRRYLALGGADSLVSIWDLEVVYCQQTFIGSQSLIRVVSFILNSIYI